MADPVAAGRYWCHMCTTAVSPLAAEAGVEIKCPYCRSGFLEEIETARGIAADGGRGRDVDGDAGTYAGADSTNSIWAPIIESMAGDSVRRRRNRRSADAGLDADEDHDLDPMDFSRRRRRATAFLRLLQAIRERQLQRLESTAAAAGEGGGFDAAERYSPYGRSLFAGGEQGMALGDYFLGSGLDALLQQLAESDASLQGTPPAKKEAVEAMPTVDVGGGGDGGPCCAVCLEDYAPGERAREMPCRHRFHSKCILPWLEMHSSCPVCRFQLPADDSSKTSCGTGAGNGSTSGITNGDGGGGNASDDGHGSAAAERDGGAEAGGNGSRLPASIQWLNSLLSQPGSSPPSTSGSSH